MRRKAKWFTIRRTFWLLNPTRIQSSVACWGGMSIFTMIMTVPQVLAIWIGHQAAGVSILSWSAYFVSAVLWLWFGIRRHDRNIYLPCLGWIALDSAVIAGAVVYG